VQWDKVDDKYISTPCRYLQEMEQRVDKKTDFYHSWTIIDQMSADCKCYQCEYLKKTTIIEG